MNNKKILKPQKQTYHNIKVIHKKSKIVNPPLKNKKCPEKMLGKR